jgi:hypothetical protein
MGVMDLNAPTAQLNTSSTVGFRWGMTFTGVPRKNFAIHTAVGAASRSQVMATPPTSTWQMVTYTHPGGASVDVVYYDGIASNSTGSAGTAGTRGAVSAPNFAIGPYSVISGWNTQAHTYQIAKIAIFMRVLTPTEMSDLYTSMTLGPPSP